MMDNPAFRNQAFQPSSASRATTATSSVLSDEQLRQMVELPSAPRESTDPMTVQDTLAKSGLAFAVLLAGAVVGWLVTPAVPMLWLGAGLVALVLGLVNTFKREPSAGLILAYAGFEGVLLGGFSMFMEAIYPGIVLQAVLATLVVVGVTLALFASGRIRASARATKIFLVIMVGYVVFSLVNVVLQFTGVTDDPWGLRGSVTIAGIPLGIVLGILAVLLGAYSLVLDFDFIQQGVRNQAPRKYGWSGAFGIMMTVVWLYLELLRMIALARR